MSSIALRFFMPASQSIHSKPVAAQQPSRSLSSIQLWLALFGLGVSILSFKSIAFNIVVNHLLYFNWTYLSCLLISTGFIGLTSFLPKPFNLWDRMQDLARAHKLSTSLIMLGVVMVNPTFTMLMLVTSIVLETHFSPLLTLLSRAASGAWSNSIEFLEFMGGLKSPFEFVKGIWANLGKVVSVTAGILSSAYFYTLMRHFIDPIAHNALYGAAFGLDKVGDFINFTFSGGVVANYILDAMATSIVYSMTVLVPLSAAFIGGAIAAKLWEKRFDMANAIDKPINACINAVLWPIHKLGELTRNFRVKYMGAKILPEPVEGYNKGKMTYEEAMEVIERRRAKRAQEKGAHQDSEKIADEAIEKRAESVVVMKPCLQRAAKQQAKQRPHGAVNGVTAESELDSVHRTRNYI